jgi:hypothetical protein
MRVLPIYAHANKNSRGIAFEIAIRVINGDIRIRVQSFDSWQAGILEL